MFKYKQLTDFEKLVVSNDYNKLLKKELRVQEKATQRAITNLENFTNHMRTYTNGTRKLISYREEMLNAKNKARKLKIEVERLNTKNFKLREQIRNNSLKI